MYHISSTLATMMVRAAAKERLSEPIRGCPKEFEDAVYRELAELHRTRPRLVAFAPTEALKRVLAFPVVRRCLGSHAERQPVPSRLTVTARGMATKIALGALAVTLIAGVGIPALAGAPHRELHGSHAQEVAAQAKRKGSKTKTVRKTFASVETAAIPAAGSTFDTGPADPYPTTISVTGFKKARITDVNLTLRGLSHDFPADIDVLLVAPGGRNAVVMDEVGSVDGEVNAVENITLTLDDEAAAVLPTEELLTAGSFRPLANGDQNFVAFPSPAPTPSRSVALSTFDGINPNGQWQLFIFDDAQDDRGALAGGWDLEITAKSKVKNTGNDKKKR